MNAGVRAAFVTLALAAAAAGCAHLQPGGTPAGPTATPSPTPSPLACGSPVPGALFVAMASYVTATTDPTYGLINGYALVAQDGTYSNVAQPVRIRPGNVVQFVNVEPATLTGQPAVQHSAAGLQSGASFPPATFPPAAQVAAGTVIGNGAWSTGRIPATSTVLCYSQAFGTPTAGTFSFGDVDFYVNTNMRDVIVVTSSAPR